MASAAEPVPAVLPLPGGAPGGHVRLRPLLTASGTAPPGYYERAPGPLWPLRAIGIGVPASRWRRLPIPAFLVEHPGAGLVLIDTGMHPSFAVDPRQSLGRIGARMFRTLEMEPEQAVSAQLRALGRAPADVRVVVMTHLHMDHTGAVSEFPDATFVVSADEWAAATRPRGALRGYLPRQFDHAFDFRLVDFDTPATDSFSTFGRSLDLFGDGLVRLLSTPGHTEGHMSVALRLGSRDALVVGDAAITRGVLEEGRFPAVVADGHLFRRSVREIGLYAREHPDALVIPGHDMDVWNALEPLYD